MPALGGLRAPGKRLQGLPRDASPVYPAAMVLIDTIALVSRLEAAGMSRQQAEAIATALAHADE